VGLHHDQDRADRQALLAELIEAPTLTRRLYPRRGFAGLEPNVLQVLIAVELHPSSTVGDVADRLALAQGTISTAVARLREERLVDAAADELDARRQLLTTTAAGRRAIDEFIASAPRRARRPID
jgi:DNA-binding MarR family transcriptional regulator